MRSKSLTRYTNIVSFNDVKEASRLRFAQDQSADLEALDSGRSHDRAQDGYGRQNARRAGRMYNYYDLSRFADPTPSRFEKRPAEDFEEAPRERYSSPSKADKRERRRRERTKARADKMFSEQFADNFSGSMEAEGAPRAALYEGNMGASQRRAARMQRASEAGPHNVKINPAGWFSSLNVSPKRLKAITAMLCLVLVAVFLYTPAQHYYQSVREHDRLAAEYASIQERNANLNTQNDSLASKAGMEDAVRQKYGYVVDGDETAVVSGLASSARTSHDDGVEANVLSSSVKAPEEWYTPYLDVFFGVS